MKYRHFKSTQRFLFLGTIIAGLCACGAENTSREEVPTEEPDSIIINRFDTRESLKTITPINATVTLDNTALESQALKIEFTTQTFTSGIYIKPETPWETSHLGNRTFMFDVKNTGQGPVMLVAAVGGSGNQYQRRAIGLDEGQTTTLYFELEGYQLNEDTGMSDTPSSLNIDALKMLQRGSNLKLDYSKVYGVKIYAEKQIRPTEIVVDNLRFESTPEPNKDYLKNMVDKFGQRADRDFELKISSETELKAAAEKELEQLANGQGWQERSKFGGWKSGPKREATGFFRTEKVNGVWSLVDPQGYLFFSSAIANARMSNTSTFTGVDYRDEAVRYIDPDDVTPEDSQQIVGDYRAAQQTHYVANQQRRSMFEWLPDYEHPLANHYGYRRKAHKGPMPHGEVFSFYQANLERRYGETSKGSYLDNWREVTLNRMSDWGFTSFGNWTDPMFYNNEQMPYFANGWIIGDFKTISSGFDIWGKMPDVFDPEFVRRANITTEVIAKEINNSPWCIGIFIDNEMSWGGSGPAIRQYGIVFDALSRDAEDSPTKAVFMRLLKEKYGDIDRLNAKWQKNHASWDKFSSGVDYKEDESYSELLLADASWLLTVYASEYFSVVRDAIKKVMPNHMYMGNRFTTWGTAPEVRDVSKEYADVVSYNYYQEGIDQATFGFLDELDAPVIIGEYHIGSEDSGHPKSGKIFAPNQKRRAEMFRNYLNSAIDNPYIVGVHWFQYIDSPITGRAHDGENYNVGFVTTTDIPYPHMVREAKETHKNMYERRYKNME